MKFLGAKKRIDNIQSLLTSIINCARYNEENGYKIDHQNLTIALFLVASFFNDSIFFYGNCKSYLLIFLFTSSQFFSVKDCVK